MSRADQPFVVWLDEVSGDDIALVGGKSASLGEMTRHLEGPVKLPQGFAVTTAAFNQMVVATPDAVSRLSAFLSDIDYEDFESLFRGAKLCRELVRDLEVPDEVATAIGDAYDVLEEKSGVAKVDVAVRSSAVSEDGKDASFAGQYESFLGIRGKLNVIERCRDCFASYFTARAVDYRHRLGLPPEEMHFAVAVQRMVRSDQACSGVLFTLEPESGSPEFIVISASWGLGEPIVQGQVQPDEYLLFKPTLRRNADLNPTVARRLGAKEQTMVYAWGGTQETEIIDTPESRRQQFVLEREELLHLARAACRLEEAYGHTLDIEWAKDGPSNELFLVQARPTTGPEQVNGARLERFKLLEGGEVLATGQAVGSKIACGTTAVIHSLREIDRFREGDVLVTERTDPDWEPAMNRAAAIVTDTGGRTSHAAIIARELGVPCVVGAAGATALIPDSTEVTVSCIQDEGHVYAGALKFEHEVHDVGEIPNPRTQVMLIVGNPSQALQQARIPNDGVGLARQEFIIASEIGIHPRALLEMDRLTQDERDAVLEKTAGYESPEAFYVERLAESVARIGTAFYPRDVIVRLTDFKSNEYRGLIGGQHFEPVEENPMLGWRGARRYYDPAYRDAFRLECDALRRAREEMALDNLKIMIPFVRTVPELHKVLEVMAHNGLERGRDGLEVYMMVEVPSNVLLLKEFAAHVDGLSIGSNDLTQLALGIDRDAAGLAEVGDERDEAVVALLRMILSTVRDMREQGGSVKVGICGQAPSDYPEVCELLVEEGIDSISVTPDMAIATRFLVAEVEAKRG